MKYLFMIASIFKGDYIIKNKIEHSLKLGEKIYLMQNQVILTKLHNKGAMLGVLRTHQDLVRIASVVISGIMSCYFAVRLACKSNFCEKLGSVMILGGGLSNTYDRVVRTYVVDYISFASKHQKLRSLVFNISDFCILFGTLLFAVGKSWRDKIR